MSYKKLIDLLPRELIEKIQEYVDGKVIYIPKKDVNKKKWGENTDIKQFLASRNELYPLSRTFLVFSIHHFRHIPPFVSL